MIDITKLLILFWVSIVVLSTTVVIMSPYSNLLAVIYSALCLSAGWSVGELFTIKFEKEVKNARDSTDS